MSQQTGTSDTKPSATRPSRREALLFSLRAAIAAALAYVCYRFTHLSGSTWAPVSAVLVMEPALRPSMRLSLVRCVANLLGAFCGAAVNLWLGTTPLAVVAGVVLTGLACHFMHLDDGRRPATVAMLIVLLNNFGGVFTGLTDRMVAVVLGCAVALLVSFAFELGLEKLSMKSDGSATAAE